MSESGLEKKVVESRATMTTSSPSSFALPGGVGFCNAVRRTLLSDVKAWAPCTVRVDKNTSCQTDEFLAHRIGLIPFRRVGNGETLRLSAVGPCVATASDFVGPGFEAVHGDIQVMRLGEGQCLELVVTLDERPASAHARYAVCAGVGMSVPPSSSSDRCRLSFSCNDGRAPREALREALDHLEARVDRALHDLAHQPSEPPASFC